MRHSAAEPCPLWWTVAFAINVLPLTTKIKHWGTTSPPPQHPLKLEITSCVRGVISPLLSNLYMRRFILGWKRTGAEQRLGAQIVNYADDLVICCKGDNAVKALETMRRLMGQLKLTVNEEKTRTCRVPEEEFDFLGYTFGQRHAAKTRRPYIATWPSRKSIRRMTEAVRIQTDRNMEWMDAGDMVRRLNQKLGGWTNYFKLGPVTKAYRFLDRYTTTRLRRWLGKKHKQSSGRLKRYPDEFFY
jgi:RNA-directed DNA polymerase